MEILLEIKLLLERVVLLLNHLMDQTRLEIPPVDQL